MDNKTLSCDFDEVYQKCKELDNLADELESLKESSNKKLSGELNSWSGDASTEMKNQTAALEKQAEERISEMREYANWLRTNAGIIEEADDALAGSIKI